MLSRLCGRNLGESFVPDTSGEKHLFRPTFVENVL